jgi:hypothetical protein
MNFGYLLKTESETVKVSNDKHPGWFSYYEELINCLFQVAYYVGEEKDVESDDGYYIAYAHNQLLKLPYTVRSVSILLERGYYLEAALLVRNILEVFVQLRFFNKYRNRLNKYVLKKDKITLKTMFSEFNPELYSQMYSALSEAAHGGFGSIVYRTAYKSATNGETIMGSVFNEIFSNYLLNQLIPLIYGVLNFIPVFFRHYKNLVPTDIELNRTSALNVLKEMMDSPPKSEEFLKDIQPLIEHGI